MPRRDCKRAVAQAGRRSYLLERLEPRTLLSTIYSADMSVNPGWTLETYAGLGWGYGIPAGTGGDPSSGYTGTRVIGTILASPGYYPDNVPSAYYAKTPAIDCSRYTGVTLSFHRWLGVGANDGATIAVSSNGTGWTSIFANGASTINETAWSLQTYDISAVADHQSTVYIRWGLGPTNASIHYSGWNIDDVTVSGTFDNPPAVSSITRLDPTPSNAGSVRYSVAFTEAVTGVDVTDFQLALTGTAAGTVSSVSGTGSVYTVTVGSIAGVGGLGLNLVDNDSIVDAYLFPLGGTGSGNGNFAGQTYTIDRVVPTVSSITNLAGSQTADTAVFEVVFSEPVSGVDLADFALVLTGTATASLAQVTGTGSVYQVTVNTPAGTGTVGLNLVDNDSVADAAANPLGGPGAGNGSFTGGTAAVNHPPANDAFANAQSIGAGELVSPFTDVWLVSGANLNATKEVGEPNHHSAGGRSIWYRWIAPATKPFEINTKGSSYDTLLAVYTGTQLSNLQTMAADDESGGSHTSKVTISALSGTTYWIAVDGYAGASGLVTLKITTNHAPTDIQLSENRVVEGTNTIGALAAVDLDAGDSFTYALVSGPGDADNALASLSSKYLYLNASTNYIAKQSYSVRVRATDSGGASVEKSFQISVVRPVGFELKRHWGGTVSAVATSGTRAFVNKGKDFVILNLSNPASPQELGRVTLAEEVRDISVAGNFAYVTFGGTLQVLDVSGSSPVPLGAYQTPGDAYGVSVVGAVAYVAADYQGGLQIIDVSNPVQPVRIGMYDTPGYARDVAVLNGIAYVADAGVQSSSSALRIIDVVRPNAPVSLGSYTVYDYSAPAVAISGSTALISNGNEVTLIDVSSPAAPVERGSYTVWQVGGAQGIAVTGNLAYLAYATKGLEIVDISNPATPVRRGGYDTAGSALAVSVVGNMAYVADDSNGLEAISISNPASPTRLGGYGRGGNVVSAAVAGNRAYVASRDGAFEILDITNPSLPVLLGSWDGLGDAQDISVSGNIACVADSSSGLQVFNVSNPASPTRVSNYIPGAPAVVTAVALAGSRAYISSFGRIRALDLSNPASPVLLGEHITDGYARQIKVVGDLVYVANDSSGMHIIDFSNPASPVAAGTSDVDGVSVWGLDVVGTTAYLGCDLEGIHVVDASSPATPVLLGAAETSGYARHMAVSGDLAHAAGSYTGYRAYDITDSSRPLLVGTYAYFAATYITQVVIDGDYAFVADGSSGMDIVKIKRAPVALGVSAATVAENLPVSSSVGVLTATDPSVADSFTYTLVAGAGDTDNGSFAIVGNALRTNTVLDFEARSSHSVRVRVTDSDGLWYERAITISVTDVDDTPPVINSTAINSGASQRSMVKSASVVFSEPVTLSAGAVTILRSGGAVVPDTTIDVANPSGDQRTYILSFSGTGAIGGSLADGVYDLLVNGAGVRDQAGNVMSGNYSQRFHRLFGDSNGDRRVNLVDYRSLRLTLGRSSGQALFNDALDVDGNGAVSVMDLTQFRRRFGMRLTY